MVFLAITYQVLDTFSQRMIASVRIYLHYIKVCTNSINCMSRNFKECKSSIFPWYFNSKGSLVQWSQNGIVENIEFLEIVPVLYFYDYILRKLSMSDLFMMRNCVLFLVFMILFFYKENNTFPSLLWSIE